MALKTFLSIAILVMSPAQGLVRSRFGDYTDDGNELKEGYFRHFDPEEAKEYTLILGEKTGVKGRDWLHAKVARDGKPFYHFDRFNKFDATTTVDEVLGEVEPELREKDRMRIARQLDEFNVETYNGRVTRREKQTRFWLVHKENLKYELEVDAMPTDTTQGGYDHILMYVPRRTAASGMQKALHAHLQRAPHDHTEKIKTNEMAHDYKIAKEYMDRLPRGHKTLVIGLVRNPFELSMAQWFQESLENVEKNPESETITLWEVFDRRRVPQCIEIYPKEKSPHDNTDYARAISNLTGINILKQPFDFERKKLFAQNEDKSVSALVLRYEDKQDWDTIMQEYVPGFKMRDVYKNIWDLYADKKRMFVKQYRFPESAVETVKSGDFTHFYTRAEFRGFTKWATRPLLPEDIAKEPAPFVPPFKKYKDAWLAQQALLDLENEQNS